LASLQREIALRESLLFGLFVAVFLDRSIVSGGDMQKTP
jgi:hypothetical protein